MLLLGPDGGNLEVGSAELTFHGKDGRVPLVPIDQILSANIVDGDRLEVYYTDLKEDYLKVKRIHQIAIDVAALQEVHSAIQVNVIVSL